MNAFQRFPQFIDTDIRVNRRPPFGYVVNYTQMLERHLALLPEKLIAGCSVLDLGCCVAATGAWVLDLGASSYTGVELQKDFVSQARENLSESFSNHNWKIIESSIENFFKTNTEKYDIVYLGGIIYTSLYYQEILKNSAGISNVAVVIESKTPDILKNQSLPKFNTDFSPIVEYVDDLGMLHEDSDNLRIRSAVPSLGAVGMILDDLGFDLDFESCKLYGAGELPSRYGGVFYRKSHQHQTQTTENVYSAPSKKTTPWNISIPSQWEFDGNIAKGFVQHARMHIPDYDKIIDLSVKLCRTNLQDPLNARIIDVGCATGETISKLYTNGCCNLVGVDNSQAMLDQCDPDRAFYLFSSDFPVEHGPYDAVICNWTLHFIKDKLNYLQKIYKGLSPGGFLILTDKTENSGVALQLYHEFKKRAGVSAADIEAKAQSIKNIMFIDSPQWYFESLKDTGFLDISVISAAPCFTTFIAFK